jgi:hemerythrin-like domain-containing protein
MKPLFPTPAAGFDDPIEILDGCHERIRRNCALVERLAAHLADHGNDADARRAAANVLRYFDTAAANHHRDEEADLFPLLQHHVDSAELNAAFDLIRRLREDHRRLDASWARMRERLEEVVQGATGGLTPPLAREFRAAYERHIALEEAELLPLARRVLDSSLLELLGNSMARRRGVQRAAPLTPAFRPGADA